MTTLKLSATTNLVKTTTMTTMTKDVDDDDDDNDDGVDGVDNDLNSFALTSRGRARIATAANFEALNNF